MLIDETLIYEGILVLEAIRLVIESNNKINTLRITSPGGDMATSIEFGLFIKENNLDVETSQLCFSVCANYALPAANNILIEKIL